MWFKLSPHPGYICLTNCDLILGVLNCLIKLYYSPPPHSFHLKKRNRLNICYKILTAALNVSLTTIPDAARKLDRIRNKSHFASNMTKRIFFFSPHGTLKEMDTI